MKKGLYEKELHLNAEDIYLNINNNKEIINRNNERISTKDDENNMMIDEAIQYCSSPKFGLVSIHASRNKKYNKFIQLTEYRNDIPNTVSMIVRPIKTIIEVEEEKQEEYDILLKFYEDLKGINEMNQKELSSLNDKLLISYDNIKETEEKYEKEKEELEEKLIQQKKAYQEQKYLESISKLLIMIQVHCEIKTDMYKKFAESGLTEDKKEN